MARRSPSVPFRGNRDPEFGLKLFYVEPEFYSDGPIVTITEEDITGENEFWKFVLVGFFVGPMPKLATILDFIKKKEGV